MPVVYGFALNWGNCHQADCLPVCGCLTECPSDERPQSGTRCRYFMIMELLSSIRKRVCSAQNLTARYQIVHFSLETVHNCICAACKCSISTFNANYYRYPLHKVNEYLSDTAGQNGPFARTCLIALLNSPAKQLNAPNEEAPYPKVCREAKYAIAVTMSGLIKIDISSHI